MRFLRLLTNSLVAGALGAAYLTILVLQLNPQIPLASASVWRWYLTLGLFYGVLLALLFYATMLVRDFFSVGIFSPGWISVRLLAWLSAAAAAVAATLMWLNRNGFPAVLDETSRRRFTFGAAATTASALVLLIIAIAHYSYGRRGSRVGAALLAIAIVGSLALPIAARGAGGEPPLGARRVLLATPPRREGGHRITLLLIDGGSLEYIWPRVASGRLPNFGRLLDSGALMDLATIRPTQPDPVWAAVATGMLPVKNGVRSAATYFALGDDRAIDLLPDHCFSHMLVRVGVVRGETNTSAEWRTRPLWSILGDYGISAGIARWPLTYPAQPIDGFLITDRFHQMTDPSVESGAAYPPDVLPLARQAFQRAGPGPQHDELYTRAAHAAAGAHPVQVMAIRYQAVDTAAHHALPDSQGDEFSEADRQAFGALDRAYAEVDREIGATLERLTAGDLLLVVSGFGMRPASPIEHVAARVLRDPDISATHEAGPDGFLLAYGSTIAPGRKPRGAIVDVTPTILYFLGVPIGRDMDGYTRADLFLPSFTADRPITFIPSHGG